MAFCPDDPWVDADDYGNAYEDEWSHGGNDDWVVNDDEGCQDQDRVAAAPEEDYPAAFVTENAEWRGDHYRRHRRLKNPSACEDLRLAARSGSLEGVDEVLDHCDDVHVDEVLRNGMTALCTAADAAQVEVVEWLLRCGANPTPEQSAFDGTYPALIAACNSACDDEERVEQCAELLISHGVDVAKCDSNLISALMYACHNGRLNVARRLLRSGAPVDAKDMNGKTAMCFAAHAGHLELVQELLNANADPKSACADGQLAEDLAFAAQHNEVADYLTAVIAGETPVVGESYRQPMKGKLEDGVLSNKTNLVYHYNDLDSFLNNLSLSQVSDALRGTSLSEVLLMDEGELEQAGVTQVGARMRIIEDGAKTMMEMWRQRPPEDDLKKRQILRKELNDTDARRIMESVSKHVTYASVALRYLQKQLAGSLATRRGETEIDDTLEIMSELCDTTAEVEKNTEDLCECIAKMTEEKHSRLPMWCATGLGSAIVAGVALYYLSDKIQWPAVLQ